MAPSRKKTTVQKPQKSQEGVDCIIDTGVYEVERIKGCKLIKGEVFYNVKWKGYDDSESTFEPELRLNCNKKLFAYMVSLLDRELYTTNLKELLEDVRILKEDRDVLQIISTLAFFGGSTCFTGTTKFVTCDANSLKYKFLEFLRDYNQSYLLYAAKLPTSDVLEESHALYAEQLRYRQELFPEYPFVRVMYPAEYDTVFYPPPPLCNIIFEPVTNKMKEERAKHLFVPKSRKAGFNGVEVFIDKKYFEGDLDLQALPYAQPNSGPRFIKGMDRTDRNGDPRFTVSLELVQEITRGWILRAAHDVRADTPLVQMTGVICPAHQAHTTLVEYGELVAFTSFIELPNSRMCLDRREFYDFSKFIGHSCNPTCGVRLVSSGNNIPDLVVYNMVPLNQTNNREITIDYFRAFTRDVRQYFLANKAKDGKVLTLFNEKIDFVQCQCDGARCRRVLYIDKSTLAKDNSKSKGQKLRAMEPDYVFRGLQLAKSSRIWTVTKGKFNE